MASALNVAVFMLKGRELKKPATDGQYKNSMYLPIPFVNSDNVKTVAAALEGKPVIILSLSLFRLMKLKLTSSKFVWLVCAGCFVVGTFSSIEL